MNQHIRNLDPVRSDDERFAEMAAIASRAKSIAFKTANGGWRQFKLSQERQAKLAALLRGEPSAASRD